MIKYHKVFVSIFKGNYKIQSSHVLPIASCVCSHVTKHKMYCFYKCIRINDQETDKLNKFEYILSRLKTHFFSVN